MTYNTQNLKKARAGETRETSDREDGSIIAGLYEHPEAKNEDGSPKQIITMYDPLFGDAQSEGVLRLGFVRIGDAPTGSIKTIVEQNLNSRIYNTNTVADDKARLDALELSELRREKAEREAKEAEAEPKTAPVLDEKVNTEAEPKTAEEKKEEGKK